MTDRTQNRPAFFNKKRIIILLIFTNLIAVFLLLNIHYNISKVKKQRQQELSLPDTLKYSDNPFYIEQTGLFNIYKNQKTNIVMLGSSFTQRVNWNELLGRTDIANRGIGSDVSEGYLHRMNNVLNLKPAICFVEIGANDIIKKLPVDSILKNTLRVINQLKSYNIEVVLTKCFYATEKLENYKSYNLKADSLNKRFDKIESAITLLDINPEIAENKTRKAAYALADGIHLNAKACLLWKKEIEKVLAQKKIPAE